MAASSILKKLEIDYADSGAGPAVLLVPSSASGKRQWRSMTETLQDRYRVVAIDPFGYGGTTPWHGERPQTLADQADLVCELINHLDLRAPLSLVGHSFGACVAWAAAERLGPRVSTLALIEPIPFFLLKQMGRDEAWREISAVRDHVRAYGAAGDWMRAAQGFVEYWQGAGSWQAMPPKRRESLASSVPPVFHEWDAVMNEATPIARWASITARTLVLSDTNTKRPVREIVEMLQVHCTHWTFRHCEGGHMMPLNASERVNSIVGAFLES